MDPDCKAAIETLVSHGARPASVADAMDRVIIHRQRRQRMDSAHRIAARDRQALNDLTPRSDD